MDRRLVLLPVLVAFLVGAAPATAWTWPVDGPVVRHFQLGGDPYAAGQHRGVDIGAATGTAVRAPAGGRVAFAGTVPRAGRTVTIETSDGYSVTLVHLGSILVARDASVVEGDTVGTVGATGDVEHPQPYVHLGVRVASEPNGYLDPLGFLPPRAEAGAVAAGGELAEPEPAGGESAPPSDDVTPSPAPAAPEEPETAPPPSQPVDAPVPAPPPPSAAAGAEISSPATEAPAPPLPPAEGAHAATGGSAAAATMAPGTLTPAAGAGGSARDEGGSGRRRQADRAPTDDSARSHRPGTAAAGRGRPSRVDGAAARAVAARREPPRSAGEAGAVDPAPSDTLADVGASPGWSLLLSAGLVALGTLALRRRPGPGSRPDPPAPRPAPVAASGRREPAAPARRAPRLESVDDLARAA